MSVFTFSYTEPLNESELHKCFVLLKCHQGLFYDNSLLLIVCLFEDYRPHCTAFFIIFWFI